ncbi:MAG: UV DNA damage repair endonuclease UvsE, partial [Chloroflexi bacterium]|nr:UV DNA damage repair endonuclease UvsE [Chloroflexota bacterium]
MPNTLSRAQREGRKLGFSIRVFGSPDLPSFDARSQGEGHLSVGLAFLRDILLYLEANRIRFYRMHSNLIPAALHSDLEGLKRQMEECSAQLEDLHTLIGRQDVRLTFHPYSQVTLNALNEEQAERSQRSLAAHALLLDGLGLGPEAVVVIHAGGIYDGMVPSSE